MTRFDGETILRDARKFYGIHTIAKQTSMKLKHIWLSTGSAELLFPLHSCGEDWYCSPFFSYCVTFKRLGFSIPELYALPISSKITNLLPGQYNSVCGFQMLRQIILYPSLREVPVLLMRFPWLSRGQRTSFFLEPLANHLLFIVLYDGRSCLCPPPVMCYQISVSSQGTRKPILLWARVGQSG